MNVPYHKFKDPLTVVSNGNSLSIYFPTKISKDIGLKRGDKLYVIISPDRLDSYFTMEQAMQKIIEGNTVYNVFNPEVIYYKDTRGKFVKSRRLGPAYDFSVTKEEIESLWTLEKVKE